MRKLMGIACVIIAGLSLALSIIMAVTVAKKEGQKDNLLWADEFDGQVGSSPDSAKWGFDIGVGDNGWGNSELQYYTDRPQNVFLDGDGHLIIKAIKENFSGVNGVTRGYTSARLVTRGKFEQAHGRFETQRAHQLHQWIPPA